VSAATQLRRQPATPLCPTLNHVFFHSIESVRLDPLLSHKTKAGLQTYSSEDFRRAVFSLCQYFQQSGLHPGDRVALLSENRPEWHIADFAILLSGLVSVPVYTTFSPAQIRYTLEHSGSAAILVSTQELWTRISDHVDSLSSLRGVIPLEDWQPRAFSGPSLPQILQRAEAGSAFEQKLRSDALSIDPDTLATIVYTSGTTGVPKGVMLTHRNIASNLGECIRRLGFYSVPRALSVLPLPHVFERLLCYGYFQTGVAIAYGDPHDLAELLPLHNPAVMGCVPRILEKIRENVFEQIRAQRRSRQAIARRLLKIGHAHIGERVLNRRPSLSGRLLYKFADLLLYRKLHKKLGGSLRYLICGGAKLAQDVEEFFLAAGILVVQGYGLTETSPVISLAPHDALNPGTVGKPLENLEVAFGEDGEIFVRGPSVFNGYFKDPALTVEAFQDGWFRTGDLGALDPDGYLVIKGRKKEMLVTAGGKNVHPVPIEDRLGESPLIRRAFVVGDGRKFVGALIVPEMAEIERVARTLNLSYQHEQELLEHPAIREVCLGEINRLQEDFSAPEQVKNFGFLDASALTDPDLITPTLKLRRGVLEQRYGAVIDQLYQVPSPVS
jgi:long-chain acyl-CoA synthetase